MSGQHFRVRFRSLGEGGDSKDFPITALIASTLVIHAPRLFSSTTRLYSISPNEKPFRQYPCPSEGERCFFIENQLRMNVPGGGLMKCGLPLSLDVLAVSETLLLSGGLTTEEIIVR
jgi:hypothetical protein